MNLIKVLNFISFFYTPLVFGKKKPTVALFYESDCPYSAALIKNQFPKAWNKFKGKYFLDLLPYGLAEQLYHKNRWIFECQHFQAECLHNKLHVCAITQLCGHAGTAHCGESQVTKLIDYIVCVTKKTDQLEATPKCAKGMDHKKIIHCAKSTEGDILFSLYGNRTKHVNPDEVPWITINGKHDKKAEANLVKKLKTLIEGEDPAEPTMVAQISSDYVLPDFAADLRRDIPDNAKDFLEDSPNVPTDFYEYLQRAVENRDMFYAAGGFFADTPNLQRDFYWLPERNVQNLSNQHIIESI